MNHQKLAELLTSTMIAIQSHQFMDDQKLPEPEEYEAAQNAFNALDDLLRIVEDRIAQMDPSY